MNAVRRWPAAGRRGPEDRKKTRPTAVCVGADPVRAARCEQLAMIYLDHVTWFGELRPAACDRRPVRTRTRITSHEGSSHTKKKGGMNYGSRT